MLINLIVIENLFNEKANLLKGRDAKLKGLLNDSQLPRESFFYAILFVDLIPF